MLAAAVASVALLAAVPTSAEPDPAPQPVPQDRMVVAPKLPDFKPKSKEERDMILGDLYKKLATTEHKIVADAVAKAIEKLWSYEFSPTTVVMAERARKAFADNDFEKSIRFQSIALELNPGFTQGWFNRSVARFKTGDAPGALADIRRVLALEPNHYYALNHLVQILVKIGDKKAALQALKTLQSVHPHFDANVPGAIDELTKDVEGQGI